MVHVWFNMYMYIAILEGVAMCTGSILHVGCVIDSWKA